MSEKQTLLFRVENPTIEAQPDGETSHEALVGQWFSPNVNKALSPQYLRKSTQTRDRHPQLADGAQLVIATVPTDRLASYHVSEHPIASNMDVESEDYIIPRDGTVPTEVIPLDSVLDELRGSGLSSFQNSMEARRRVIAHLGELSAQGAIPPLQNAA